MDHKPQLDSDEDRAEQSYAANIRFKHQLFLGAGGAMIFGLVGAISTKLLGAVLQAGIAASVGPAIGLVAVAAIGLGCIYLGSKFLTRGISLDQERQARKIHEVAKGKERSIPTIEPEMGTQLPGGMGTADEQADKVETLATTPSTKIDSAQWVSKMVTNGTDLSQAPANNNSWVDRGANDSEKNTSVSI